jgi:hypothetical protein
MVVVVNKKPPQPAKKPSQQIVKNPFQIQPIKKPLPIPPIKNNVVKSAVIPSYVVNMVAPPTTSPPTSGCGYRLTPIELAEYAHKYPDAVTSCGGTDPTCIQNHWQTIGCKEGRTYELPSRCSYTFTDKEALCYIQNNNLGYQNVGNDLNKARDHWKTGGCIAPLSYECPDARYQQEIRDMTAQMATMTDRYNHIQEEYNRYKEETDIALRDILTMEISSVALVSNAVELQNKKLSDEIDLFSQDTLAQSQGANYTSEKNNSLFWFNGILFWVYIVALFIFAGLFVGWKVSSLSLFNKLCVVFLFLAYPYFISIVTTYLFFIFGYLGSFLN